MSLEDFISLVGLMLTCTISGFGLCDYIHSLKKYSNDKKDNI